MTTTTQPAPAGVDPRWWQGASWYARQQLLAAIAQRPVDEQLRQRREPRSSCQLGHELTPANVYAPPGRPTKRECRECRRARWRIRQRQRRAAERAARLAATTTTPTTDRSAA